MIQTTQPSAAYLTVALAWLTLSPVAWANPDFTRPAQTFDAENQLEPLKQEIAQKQCTDAATRIDGLLREHGDELMVTENGGLLAVSAWFDLLDAPSKAAVTPEYRARFDADAKNALDAVRRNPAYGVADCYAVARRFPLSEVAGEALELAGDRAMDQADGEAALTLYRLAEESGWEMDGPRTHIVSLLGKKGQSGSGAVAFNASWYGRAEAGAQPRFFPLATADGWVFLGPKGIARALATGALNWSSSAPPASKQPDPDGDARRDLLAFAPYHRPALFSGALLSDIDGKPQIVIVRQPTDKPDRATLRAFRMVDGSLLWDAQNQPDLHDQVFVGAPTVCGRYVYAVALATDPAEPRREAVSQSTTLSLLALDTASGQLLWQCPLGSYSTHRSHRGHSINGPPAWLEACERSEPAVAGDAIYVAPGGGMAVCVGRFDGTIRWVRPYVPDGPPADQRDPWRNGRFHTDDLPPPSIDPKLAVRFRDTPAVCDGCVVLAPADHPSVFGFDRISGAALWENPELAGMTLIGATSSAVLLQSESVTAIDPHTGKMIWSWKPHTDAITGPAVLRDTPAGPLLLVPMRQTVSVLNAMDGSGSEQAPDEPSFRRFIQSDAGRTDLDLVGASKSFGPPPSP